MAVIQKIRNSSSKTSNSKERLRIMKRTLIILLTVLIILSAAIPAAAKSKSKEIVVNGDFESYDRSTMLPKKWETHFYKGEVDPSSDNVMFNVEKDANYGMVLHISVKEADDAAVYQSVRVEPSSFYRLSCRIKTKDVKNGAGANIALRDIIARSDGVYGNTDWQTVELVGKTGPYQNSMVISCRVGGYSSDSSGDAWFDDFKIEKISGSDGRIVPFYSGEVKEDEIPTENTKNNLWIYILIALAVIAAAVVASVLLVIKKKDKSTAKGKKSDKVKKNNSKNEESAAISRDLLNQFRGKNFFSMSADNALNRTDIKLHFTKKDWIFVSVLTGVYAVIALVNLGTLKFPVNAWSGNTGDSVRIDFGRSVKISQVWQNSGVSNINYVLETDDGKEIAIDSKDRSTYGRMFRWAKLSGASSSKATTGVTLTVMGGDYGRKNDPDLVLNELVFFDENGDKIECTVPESAKALFDEQDTVPKYPSFFNGMYFDELYHGRTAFEHINNLQVYEWTHPPLGKLFIALGILIFGMKPFGWRIVGTLFGIAMVPLMYCFGKRVLKRSTLALFSTFLFTFDFMHFTQTRIATVDVYGVFFILLMTYFMFQFLSMDIGDRLIDMMRELALSGIFFGFGCASKWICMYTGVGLAVMFFLKLLLMTIKSIKCSIQLKNPKIGKMAWIRPIVLCLWCVLFFVIIPASIYAASYCRYYTAEWKPARQTEIYRQNRDKYDSADQVKLDIKDAAKTYVKGVINNQKDMYSYHSTLKSDHSASSPWWSWLFDLRPTWFYCGGSDNPHGYIGTISAFGNPAVWTLCTLATAGMIVSLIHRKRFPTEVLFILIALGSSFLPWVLVPRSTYAYHFFASVPFITLASGYLIGYIENWSSLKRAVKGVTSPGFVPWIKYIWMIAAGVLFILFYPVISGTEVPYWYIHMLQWVPFHKFEVIDKNDGSVLKTIRLGWRFLDYEPSGNELKDWMITKLYK